MVSSTYQYQYMKAGLNSGHSLPHPDWPYTSHRRLQRPPTAKGDSICTPAVSHTSADRAVPYLAKAFILYSLCVDVLHFYLVFLLPSNAMSVGSIQRVLFVVLHDPLFLSSYSLLHHLYTPTSYFTLRFFLPPSFLPP